jgi:hypothetical protein
MNILPLWLELAEVATAEAETGTRWTLGPTWYNCNQDDTVPFYDDGDRSIEDADPNSQAIVPVRTWASLAIARTTNYRVTGWVGLVPTLERVDHQLEIRTLGGTSYLLDCPASIVQYMIDRLRDPNDVIVMPRRGIPNTKTYIPVRAVAAVDYSVTRTPVTNFTKD